ncbi:hypothetical protein FRC20_002077 [Serendipita sp. 405]|nr:hypothetical protein FRC16_004299 [Serendipita sp. 398]KAG8869113.1 hypothetical protein FRC20_002077 [Serendipita sp. 405]
MKYSPSILPDVSIVSEVPFSDSLTTSMTKLTKNSNKRKGFKDSMKGIVSNHRIFENGNKSLSVVEQKKSFVAPSQRSHLPANILVTSVDVEFGVWDRGREDPPLEVAQISRAKEDHAEYVATQRDPPEERSFWETVEANWETYPTVQADTSPLVGTVVIWKDLVLNPRTFTPELVIRAAKILDITENDVELEEIIRDMVDGESDPNSEPLSAIKRTDLNGYRICT